MFRRIQGFRLGLEAQRSPFDQEHDIVGQHYLFIYLTGRGEYSYLFPHTTESNVIDEAARSIPMGSTQIWILTWMTALRPEPGKKITPSQRRAAQNLKLDRVEEGSAYVLIGETGQCFGCTERLQAALGASRLIAVERSVRIAIGLLQANVPWH